MSASASSQRRTDRAGLVLECRVPQEPDAVELPLTGEWLRIDDEPRLTLRTQHVPAVQVLVHEERRAPVCAAKDIHRVVEQRTLERSPAVLEPVRHLFGPPLGLVGEQPERTRLLQLQRQAREQLGDNCHLIGVDVRERRSRPAPLAEVCPTCVVARNDAHGSVARPALERLRLVIGLEVRRRVQLEHDLPRRHDERVGRVDRLLQLQAPLLGALGDERGEGREPLGLVLPLRHELGREMHAPIVGSGLPWTTASSSRHSTSPTPRETARIPSRRSARSSWRRTVRSSAAARPSRAVAAVTESGSRSTRQATGPPAGRST